MFPKVARSTKLLSGLALALALASSAGGCGGEASDVPEAAGVASSLQSDLTMVKAPVGVALEAPAEVAASKGSAPAPKVIYLVYADGKTPLPATNYDACSGLAPKFECTFGKTLLDCQQQVQAYLDRWYADFNVIFTLTRPSSGSFYTEVVSSGGGGWCKVDSAVAGVAPFLCQDLHGGVAYTLDGGANAHDTAVIIAQEQAHLIGLEHVSDNNDIMYPYICQNCDGFKNQALAVTGDRCDRQTQNSYQMMMSGLGAWGGGPKPSAFGCINDTAAPKVTFLSPSEGQRMGHDFSVKVDAHDDCDLGDRHDQRRAAGLVGDGQQRALRVGSDRDRREPDDHRLGHRRGRACHRLDARCLRALGRRGRPGGGDGGERRLHDGLRRFRCRRADPVAVDDDAVRRPRAPAAGRRVVPGALAEKRMEGVAERQRERSESDNLARTTSAQAWPERRRSVHSSVRSARPSSSKRRTRPDLDGLLPPDVDVA